MNIRKHLTDAFADLRNAFATAMEVKYREKQRTGKVHVAGKHHGSKNAPTCPACRVTLSHGDCRNRMCASFVGRKVA